MTPIRVGIVGCGVITRNVHIPVLLALPNVKLMWMADVNTTSGAALSRASGIRFHPIRAENVDLPEADLVALAIPNGARPIYYEHLSKRPAVGLYVEKPLARSIAEHRYITGGRPPSHVAVGLDRRSYAVTRAACELFQYLPFGAPLSASLQYGGLGGLQTGGSYMADPAMAEGGTLYQVGVHFLDAIVFASRAVDVSLVTGHQIQFSGLDIHIDGQLSLELHDGSHIPLDVVVTQLRPVTNRVQIVFERATVRFSVMYGTTSLEIVSRDDDQVNWKLTPRDGLGAMEMFASFALHWTNVIDALRTGRENYTSASQAMLTTKALELLYSLPCES